MSNPFDRMRIRIWSEGELLVDDVINAENASVYALKHYLITESHDVWTMELSDPDDILDTVYVDSLMPREQRKMILQTALARVLEKLEEAE